MEIYVPEKWGEKHPQDVMTCDICGAIIDDAYYTIAEYIVCEQCVEAERHYV